MTRLLTSIAVISIFAGAAQAQVRQASVGGTTDDPVYSEKVQGSDGVAYKCKPGVVVEKGVSKRICLPIAGAAAAASVFNLGNGINAPGPLIGVAVAAVAVAAAAGDDSSSATTTTSN